MLLFYLRHGDPIYDPDSLTPLGMRQAEALAKRLALYGLDEIYVSTSQRAKLTAKPTCEVLGIEPVELDWCNEKYAWAQLTVPREGGGMTWLFHSDKAIEQMLSAEVRALDRKWYTHPFFAETKAGEGILRIQREADSFLASLGYEHDAEKGMYFSRAANEKRVALFAHQGFGLAFLSCVLDVPYPQFSTHFDTSHTGMSVIHFPEREGWIAPKLLQLSNDSHLLRDGLPTAYHNQIRF